MKRLRIQEENGRRERSVRDDVETLTIDCCICTVVRERRLDRPKSPLPMRLTAPISNGQHAAFAILPPIHETGKHVRADSVLTQLTRFFHFHSFAIASSQFLYHEEYASDCFPVCLLYGLFHLRCYGEGRYEPD